MSSFKNQVISSSKWAVLNQLVTQGIRIIVSIYLMRLLAPESFGVFMQVLSIIGISEILVGLRMGGGIVQAKEVNQNQLSTIYWMNFTVSLILTTVFFLSGDLIANFYHDHRLVALVQTASFVVIFIGIGYVPRSILTKKLDFRSIFISNLVGVSVSSSIGVWMALSGYDYWSLLWLWASYHIIISSMYWYQSKFIPQIVWNTNSIKKLWYFSRKIALNDILNYSARNIDNIIIGRVLGAASLGIYSRAYNIMLLPLQNFANIINGVLFPSFSLIQDEKERISAIFYKAVSSISFLTLPFMLFLWLFADDIVLQVLGNEWLGLPEILRILIILGIIQIHTSFAASIFLATGRSDIPLNVSYVSKPILITVILITVNYGISVVAIGITIIAGISSIVQLILAVRVVKLHLFTLFIGLS